MASDVSDAYLFELVARIVGEMVTEFSPGLQHEMYAQAYLGDLGGRLAKRSWLFYLRNWCV
jgi:hypothetical protein